MTHLLLILLIVLVKRKYSDKFLFCFYACPRAGKFYPTGENLKPPLTIEQKGMIIYHDFGYSFSLFTSLLKKEGRRKGEWIAKIVIKSHAFLLDRIWRAQAVKENLDFCTEMIYLLNREIPYLCDSAQLALQYRLGSVLKNQEIYSPFSFLLSL